jgi:hypothetical protein
MVVDAGALIALERDERAMWVRLKRSLGAGSVPVTHGGIVGQVWKGGARQARLAHALGFIEVRSLDEGLGRRAGEMLATTGRSDVLDAALVLLAADGDEIITTDLEDLALLAAASGLHVEIFRP